MVEHRLAKARVAGSSPVSRSNLRSLCSFPGKAELDSVQCRQAAHGRFVWSLVGIGARYPSGKGEVCKTFMRRFDPDPRLQVFSRHRVSSTT